MTANHGRRVFICGGAVAKVNRDPSKNLLGMTRNVIADLLFRTRNSPREISGLFVGSMLAPVLQRQSQLAAQIAANSVLESSLGGLSTMTVDVASASGAAALRAGILAVKSGMHDRVIVLGVEEMMSFSNDQVTQGLAQASDWNTEGSQGKTFVSLNDDLMGEYLARYQDTIDREDFFHFPRISHKNAVTSPHAVFRNEITREDYEKGPALGNHVRLLDACPTANGCAALLLSSKPFEDSSGAPPVTISGSGCATDYIDLSKREDILKLNALSASVEQCLSQAGLSRNDIGIYETHDAYSIMNALCLESAGFVDPGKSLDFVKSGETELTGSLPGSTMGGLKARGHPIGASSVYQIYETMLQLQGRAGANQVLKQNAPVKNALVSSFGGAASTVLSHILSS